MRDIGEIAMSGKIKNMIVGMDGFSGLVRMSGYTASIIVSDGAGWEHASISPMRNVTPSWDDMCKLKDLIWNDDETVIQIHPPKDQYVNNVGNCLHLWRCAYKDMLLPPSCLVGIRKGQTRASLEKEIKEAYEMAGEVYE